MVMASSEETVTIVCLVSSTFVSVLLMIVCVYHWQALRVVHKRQDIQKMRQVVKKAKKALQCGRLTAVEIAVLATQAGMTLEQIEEAYRIDSQARKEVLMSVLGGTQKNPFVQKFMQDYPSRFLSSGYTLEWEFLHGESTEREEMRNLRTALVMKTQGDV